MNVDQLAHVTFLIGQALNAPIESVDLYLRQSLSASLVTLLNAKLSNDDDDGFIDSFVSLNNGDHILSIVAGSLKTIEISINFCDDDSTLLEELYCILDKLVKRIGSRIDAMSHSLLEPVCELWKHVLVGKLMNSRTCNPQLIVKFMSLIESLLLVCLFSINTMIIGTILMMIDYPTRVVL